MTSDPNHYPSYSCGERVADGTVHAIGVIGALMGATAIVLWTAMTQDAARVAAVTVYGLALIATYVASSLYHFTPWEAARPIFRRFDHAAIFVKIAGTYTPFVVLIGTASAYVLLAAMWCVALYGVLRKIFFRSSRGSVLLYLAMGWMGAWVILGAVTTLPVAVSVLVIVGGLLYTVGVIFYRWEGLKFSNAIWHGFVLAATICFYVAISLGVGTVV
ncbi:PAQR family membrane homeostasis protein TrhA [Roseobacter sp. HKCCA0434]|uniref:PAQR family membrane homeostasis protein TrhA n=1 Tax=Roseobacter sp. HKCCA0434 TaxID=3079297 RepID=UPI002905A90E|nr:hemolysin III family protein [Roseobacter sp. HKCCA0434]